MPFGQINRLCATALLFLLLVIYKSNADYTVATSRMQIVFSDRGDILAVTPRFEVPPRRLLQTTFFSSDGRPILRFETSPAERDSIRSPFTEQTDSATVVRFIRSTAEITYRLSSTDYAITAAIRPVNHFQPAASPTVLHLHRAVTASADTVLSTILVTRRNASVLKSTTGFSTLNDTEFRWIGVRNRFWALLVERGGAAATTTDGNYSLRMPGDSAAAAFRFYAGPVDYRELGKVERSCTNLLYPLWRWMRCLSIGLLVLFNALLSLTDNCVVSIVLLSVAVKVILAPLYYMAHRLQREVNRQKSIIEPRLQELRRTFKGEEQTKRILALHKELGISPLYTLKSLVSAGIQIPVFFAAYHMLSENMVLLHQPLLWIKDLAQPDHSIPLPFTVFLIGNRLNVLPFIMTAITIASSSVHTDHSLSSSLHRQQQRSLYAMAVFFFLLLYSSPAGMLLYWTMNNLLSFFSSLFTMFIARGKPAHTPESETV
jgi:YidC/Oxa1 family membrane protein insertase